MKWEIGLLIFQLVCLFLVFAIWTVNLIDWCFDKLRARLHKEGK